MSVRRELLLKIQEFRIQTIRYADSGKGEDSPSLSEFITDILKVIKGHTKEITVGIIHKEGTQAAKVLVFDQALTADLDKIPE